MDFQCVRLKILSVVFFFFFCLMEIQELSRPMKQFSPYLGLAQLTLSKLLIHLTAPFGPGLTWTKVLCNK